MAGPDGPFLPHPRPLSTTASDRKLLGSPTFPSSRGRQVPLRPVGESATMPSCTAGEEQTLTSAQRRERPAPQGGPPSPAEAAPLGARQAHGRREAGARISASQPVAGARAGSRGRGLGGTRPPASRTGGQDGPWKDQGAVAVGDSGERRRGGATAFATGSPTDPGGTSHAKARSDSGHGRSATAWRRGRCEARPGIPDTRPRRGKTCGVHPSPCHTLGVGCVPQPVRVRPKSAGRFTQLFHEVPVAAAPAEAPGPKLVTPSKLVW